MTHLIEIVAFRGGGEHPRYHNEHNLIKAGHLAICLHPAQGGPLWGFRPTAQARASFPDDESVFNHLRARYVLDAGVFDDTAIFVRARELARTHPRTAVWKEIRSVSDVELGRIGQALQRERAVPSTRYRWPAKDGQPMPHGVNNCATWLRELGLHLIEPTGQMSEVIDILEAQGQPW